MTSNQSILESSDLNQAIDIFRSELQRTLNQIALEKPMKTRNSKKPWFDKELYDQRRIMKNRERVWLKHQDTTKWKAYTRERNRFNTMLKVKKCHSLHTIILESKHDIKKLYKIINNMISGKTQNPMPPNKTDEQLANEFANHF